MRLCIFFGVALENKIIADLPRPIFEEIKWKLKGKEKGQEVKLQNLTDINTSKSLAYLSLQLTLENLQAFFRKYEERRLQ